MKRNRVRQARSLIALAILGVLCAGCATMMNGESQPIYIQTKPAGANCSVGGRAIVTPATVHLPRGTNYHVECLVPGYYPAYASISGRVSGWTFVDLLGLIGLAVDFNNGAAFNLSPSEINLELIPKKALPGEEKQ